MNVKIEGIFSDLLKEKGVELDIQREDKIHPFISGNKWRKLKYTLQKFNPSIHKQIITFGGAFSNHLSATAFACKQKNIKLICVIRNPYTEEKNPTIRFLEKNLAKIEFISREEYKKIRTNGLPTFLEEKYPNSFIIPEGGSGEDGIKGCEEITDIWEKKYDVVACSIGTGTTFSGIMNQNKKTKGLGFVMLKDKNYLDKEIANYIKDKNCAYLLNRDFNFGGFGKVNDELIEFINWFYNSFKIPLDPIYTAKLFYGIFNLIKNDYFKPGTKIIAIHTGGLQGVLGINYTRKKKNKSLINFEKELHQFF